jgi:hypothetical protein
MLVREDVEIYVHAPQTKAEHFRLSVRASWHLEKLHHCYETSGLWHHQAHLITYNVHPSTGSNSTIQCNYRTSKITRYCYLKHRSTSTFHSWNQPFRIIGFLKHSPNINLGWCWNNMKNDWSDQTTYFQSSDVQVLWSITPYFSPFGIVFSN